MRRKLLVPLLSLLSLLSVAILALLLIGPPRQTGDPSGTSASPATDVGQDFATVPPFELTERSGTPFQSGALEGKVWVAGFIFTRCHHTCPMVTGVMARLRSEIPEEVHLASFSVDPEHDTPEVLTEHVKDLDTTNWLFFTGQRDPLYELIRQGFKLGVKENPNYGKEPGELISHSTRLALVDRQMRIRGYFDAADQAQMDQLKGRIRNLLDE